MNEELKQFIESPKGRFLKDWLMDWVRDLESIQNVHEFADDKEQALEIKTRKGVHSEILKKLNEILAIASEKKPNTPTPQEKVEKAREHYGLPKI